MLSFAARSVKPTDDERDIDIHHTESQREIIWHGAKMTEELSSFRYCINQNKCQLISNDQIPHCIIKLVQWMNVSVSFWGERHIFSDAGDISY